MALLTTQQITLGGVSPAYSAAAAGGDQFDPDSRTYLHVKNGGGASCTLTIRTPGQTGSNAGYTTQGGAVLNNRTNVVAAGTERVMGPFDPTVYNDYTGVCSIAYDQVASVTIAVLRLPGGAG